MATVDKKWERNTYSRLIKAGICPQCATGVIAAALRSHSQSGDVRMPVDLCSAACRKGLNGYLFTRLVTRGHIELEVIEGFDDKEFRVWVSPDYETDQQ